MWYKRVLVISAQPKHFYKVGRDLQRNQKIKTSDTGVVLALVLDWSSCPRERKWSPQRNRNIGNNCCVKTCLVCATFWQWLVQLQLHILVLVLKANTVHIVEQRSEVHSFLCLNGRLSNNEWQYSLRLVTSRVSLQIFWLVLHDGPAYVSEACSELLMVVTSVLHHLLKCLHLSKSM